MELNKRAMKQTQQRNWSKCFPGRANCNKRTLCSTAVRDRKHNTTQQPRGEHRGTIKDCKIAGATTWQGQRNLHSPHHWNCRNLMFVTHHTKVDGYIKTVSWGVFMDSLCFSDIFLRTKRLMSPVCFPSAANLTWTLGDFNGDQKIDVVCGSEEAGL